jgi:hypothetical protein
MLPMILFQVWCECPEQQETDREETSFITIIPFALLMFFIIVIMRTDANSEGCFHGSNKVTMFNGTYKRCDEIVKGDVVSLANQRPARVVCVMKIRKTESNTIRLVKFPCGLIITEYHPIKIKDWWAFPKNIATHVPFTEPFDAVYSFLLENEDGSPVECGMLIEGFECASLGHNISGEVIGHEFFGNMQAVKDALISVNAAQYNEGRVDVTHLQRMELGNAYGFTYNP